MVAVNCLCFGVSVLISTGEKGEVVLLCEVTLSDDLFAVLQSGVLHFKPSDHA